MANPGDLPSIMVLADRLNAQAVTIGELRAELAEEREERRRLEKRVDEHDARLGRVDDALATCLAINVLDAEIALIRDGMSQTALGGGE